MSTPQSSASLTPSSRPFSRLSPTRRSSPPSTTTAAAQRTTADLPRSNHSRVVSPSDKTAEGEHATQGKSPRDDAATATQGHSGVKVRRPSTAPLRRATVPTIRTPLCCCGAHDVTVLLPQPLPPQQPFKHHLHQLSPSASFRSAVVCQTSPSLYAADSSSAGKGESHSLVVLSASPAKTVVHFCETIHRLRNNTTVSGHCCDG